MLAVFVTKLPHHHQLYKGAFTYDMRFLGRQVGLAASDFTKQAYVVKYLIRVGR